MTEKPTKNYNLRPTSQHADRYLNFSIGQQHFLTFFFVFLDFSRLENFALPSMPAFDFMSTEASP